MVDLKEGSVYSCGGKIFRKIIKFDGDHLIFAKCYHTRTHGMYVIGAGVHLNKRILKSSFKNWVRRGKEDWSTLKCTQCCVVLIGEIENSCQLCKECYES